MKRTIAMTMAMLISLQAFADCDFVKDIMAQPDGNYLYSRACHLEVGKRVQALKLREAQIVDLNKTIELKDLALTDANARVKMWMDTSVDLNDKLLKYDAAAKSSNTMSFGLGIAAAVVSVWAAGQIAKH